MVQRFSTNFSILAIILDIVSIEITYALFGIFNFGWTNQSFLLFGLPILWVIILFFNSVYDGIKTLRVIDEFTYISFASAISVLVQAGLIFFIQIQITRTQYVRSILVSYLLLIIWRIIARALYKRKKDLDGGQTRYLILGAGPVGKNMYSTLAKLDLPGYKFVGFLDDDDKKNSYPHILGGIDLLASIIELHKVNLVFIALPRHAQQRILFAINTTAHLPVKISIIPDYFDLTVHNTSIGEIGGIPILDMRSPALTPNQRLEKRVFDIFFSLLLLIPAIPLMALVALAIWIMDGKPIFFTQKRLGENGQLVTIRKFRTMKPDSTVSSSIKIPEDDRITKVGRILRRTSLDELPQLFDVLSGNLSLVGPRPELPDLFEKYQDWQRVRLTIPQGLTGWWQINGRSDKPLMFNTEYDLYYIQNYSIFLDLFILVKTFWIVIRGKGAY